jgi:hypothetical protein
VRSALVVASGLVLGLLAFLADAVCGVSGQVLVALTSSGLAWGLATCPPVAPDDPFGAARSWDP